MPTKLAPVVARACVAVLAGLLFVVALVVVQPLVVAAQGPAGSGGYWLAGADGSVYSFGGAPFEGSGAAFHLHEPIVGMAATADGFGYWLAGRNGGIYSFGDAGFYGSPAGLPASVRPAAPVVAIQATPDGRGYWVLTRNGAVYSFGDAVFSGSLGGHPPPKPAVGLAATFDGRGYWIVTSDGSIFSFGDAPFEGGANTLHLSQPVTGIATAPSGNGYWLVAADGGVLTFGSAPYEGSLGGTVHSWTVAGIAPTGDGNGYWLVASNGGVYSYGDAPFRGSEGGQPLTSPLVGIVSARTADPYQPGAVGYDISFPQCAGGTYPAPPVPFEIVGVNDGRGFTTNPCLGAEAASAGPGLSVYMNLNMPPAGSTQGLTGPGGQCVGNDTACIAYNYGYNAASASGAYATSAGVRANVWWLDIETGNSWDTSTFNNDRTIQGAIDALSAAGVVVGIYSTSLQWGKIAGSYAPGRPIWVATGANYTTATQYCSAAHAFGGGTTWLTQFGTSGVPFDQDYACSVLAS